MLEVAARKHRTQPAVSPMALYVSLGNRNMYVS